ncbi:MAG: hypothetical protein EON86_13670 [Brevundimonas sp.]|nr:MAG: hypothetical protein EON86_13670 [Brevundimonas sp.]
MNAGRPPASVTASTAPMIRQQLQVLRDRGWLAFGDRRGTYRRA